MKKTKRINIIFLSLSALCAALHLAFTLSEDFADLFNKTVAHFFRLVLAKATSPFPFSLAEILLFSVPLIIAALVIYINKKGGSVKARLISAASFFLTITACVYILFVLTFAAGYQSSELDGRLDMKKNGVSKEELYETLCLVIERTNQCAENIKFEADGSSALPLEYDELSHEICASYHKVFEKYELGNSYDSSVKTLIISPIMTYTHISGVYSFFTGEANINTNYPDYVVAFTVAHEKAHQRGIAGEDEANFIAFLACAMSDDDYIEYAAYMSMYDYFLDSLYKYDSEMYRYLIGESDKRVLSEMYAYSVFFDKYRNSTASKVANEVNDTYIKVMGDGDGVESYGRVVELVCGYIKKNSLP